MEILMKIHQNGAILGTLISAGAPGSSWRIGLILGEMRASLWALARGPGTGSARKSKKTSKISIQIPLHKCNAPILAKWVVFSLNPFRGPLASAQRKALTEYQPDPPRTPADISVRVWNATLGLLSLVRQAPKPRRARD